MSSVYSWTLYTPVYPLHCRLLAHRVDPAANSFILSKLCRHPPPFHESITFHCHCVRFHLPISSFDHAGQAGPSHCGLRQLWWRVSPSAIAIHGAGRCCNAASCPPPWTNVYKLGFTLTGLKGLGSRSKSLSSPWLLRSHGHDGLDSPEHARRTGHLHRPVRICEKTDQCRLGGCRCGCGQTRSVISGSVH